MLVLTGGTALEKEPQATWPPDHPMSSSLISTEGCTVSFKNPVVPSSSFSERFNRSISLVATYRRLTVEHEIVRGVEEREEGSSAQVKSEGDV